MYLKKIVCLTLILVFPVISIIGCQPKTEKPVKVKGRYYSVKSVVPKERKAEILFNVNVAREKEANKVRLWLPYPVSNELQDISDVKIKGNYSYQGIYREGKNGNSIIYAEWIQPSETPELSFSFKVARREVFKKNFHERGISFPPETKKYLLSPLSSVCEKAKEVVPVITAGKETFLEKAEAIYDYIVVNFRRDDAIVGCGKGKVADLLNTRKGKCVDVHSVFNELARKAGIPAKEIFGIRIPPDKEGDMVKAYHCRSEFYLPEFGWVPVDASDVLKFMKKENLALNDPKVQEKRRYFFGAQNENYIDFGEGRDIVLNPKQAGKPLNYFMYPYAEVDGEPLNFLDQKELKYSVSYKEL